jgi:hypothetical protein
LGDYGGPDLAELHLTRRHLFPLPPAAGGGRRRRLSAAAGTPDVSIPPPMTLGDFSLNSTIRRRPPMVLARLDPLWCWRRGDALPPRGLGEMRRHAWSAGVVCHADSHRAAHGGDMLRGEHTPTRDFHFCAQPSSSGAQIQLYLYVCALETAVVPVAHPWADRLAFLRRVSHGGFWRRAPDGPHAFQVR